MGDCRCGRGQSHCLVGSPRIYHILTCTIETVASILFFWESVMIGIIYRILPCFSSTQPRPFIRQPYHGHFWLWQLSFLVCGCLEFGKAVPCRFVCPTSDATCLNLASDISATEEYHVLAVECVVHFLHILFYDFWHVVAFPSWLALQ
ncbi:hypothetical protein M758_11G165600 [Ceratodon purpureus]|nr:hypothetical protein M758_11G165500 [Ceratodon purpureus]KAG0602183.1 hypothetical protein M758_11G165600 [Ceratodon purpureus]